jgi:cyclophilin family peptidyl-prolyl cis-trans isomerase
MGTDKRARQKANRQARLEREQQQARRNQTKRSFRNIVIFSVVAFALLLWLSSRGGDEEEVATTGSTTTLPTATTLPKVPAAPGPGASITGETPCPAEDGSAERTTTFEKPPPMCLEDGVDYVAVIETDRGQVQVALDTENAPNTANNFAVLARYHYYDNTALFRTDPSIDIIQGGSPHTNDPSPQELGYTIQDEGNEFTYQPGDVVMARTGEPNSASGQFFFGAGPNVAGLDFNPDLPGTGTYVRFGRVIAGLDVLEAILASHVPSGNLGGYPSPPVVITSVTIVPADEAPTPTSMVPPTTATTATTAISPSTTAPAVTTTAP